MNAKPIDDGGTAFPATEEHGLNSGLPGMTLRDYFAAEALPTMLSMDIPDDVPAGIAKEVIAISCYEMADAMLKARKA